MLFFQVNQEWMQKLVAVSRQNKNSLNQHFVECWNTVVNPFSTVLYILENIHMLDTG